MSYEGYIQAICTNGHFFNCGDDWNGLPPACLVCKQPVAWENCVDETNCDSWGEIPYELIKSNFLLEAEMLETCDLGHKHITRHAVFRIPSKEESDPLRHYRPGYGGTPLVPFPPKI